VPLTLYSARFLACALLCTHFQNESHAHTLSQVGLWNDVVLLAIRLRRPLLYCWRGMGHFCRQRKLLVHMLRASPCQYSVCYEQACSENRDQTHVDGCGRRIERTGRRRYGQFARSEGWGWEKDIQFCFIEKCKPVIMKRKNDSTSLSSCYLPTGVPPA